MRGIKPLTKKYYYDWGLEQEKDKTIPPQPEITGQETPDELHDKMVQGMSEQEKEDMLTTPMSESDKLNPVRKRLIMERLKKGKLKGQEI